MHGVEKIKLRHRFKKDTFPSCLFTWKWAKYIPIDNHYLRNLELLYVS
jgi:hypothetical protein